MDDTFEIPVSYKGKDILLPARLMVFGYSHRIVVTVDAQEIYFEPDEERNYRAIIDPANPEKAKPIDLSLLKVIAGEIEALLK